MASRTSRVVLNRKAMDRIELAVADGAFAVGKAVIAAARPPDAAPYGHGLVEGGGVIAYLNGKKVDGTTIGGKQVKKPRRVDVADHTVVVIAGFGFPGRFAQFGTSRMRGNPFLTRAVAEIAAKAESIFRQAAAYRIARLRR